ncbi:hypothetical protein [Nitrosovibrio sp. Nv6]|uniref:hypothetical protein n=1 Tax=Nitrosovibrio sp. Nv6 TaxID=1855340 RepID=UPI0011C4A924|nr:hypothetical protein [Nitrosovibrio sp. Nv6]
MGIALALTGKGWEWAGLKGEPMQADVPVPHECLSPHKSPSQRDGGRLLGGFVRAGLSACASGVGVQARCGRKQGLRITQGMTGEAHRRQAAGVACDSGKRDGRNFRGGENLL